jgi:hypothetical protein
MPVPLRTVLDASFNLMAALVNVQLPVAPVTQLAVPPGEKLPATVAPETVVPLLTSRTVTTAEALQLPPVLAALPAMDLIATVFAVGAGAALPLPSE